jgi:hypothetical protein
MGFLSNLKNAVTGGSATVRVHAQPGQRGQPLPVRVEATAKASASVNEVYVQLRAVELAQVRDSDYADGRTRTEIVHGRRVSFEIRVGIAGAQALQEGQTYQWDAAIEIPPDVNPTLHGQMIQHTWEIQAGLDMKGNDPDSGWQVLEVC